MSKSNVIQFVKKPDATGTALAKSLKEHLLATGKFIERTPAAPPATNWDSQVGCGRVDIPLYGLVSETDVVVSYWHSGWQVSHGKRSEEGEAITFAGAQEIPGAKAL